MSNKRVSSKGLTRREWLKYSIYGSLSTVLSPGFWLGGCTERKKIKGPNIILVTLDTTRADHLSCYGYFRRTSPNLDRLAEESDFFTRVIAPSSWTLPSHASLFTGKFTSSHGARYDPEGPLHLTDAISGPKAWQVYRARGLAENEITLAGILKQAGYSTGAVVGGPWMKKIFGLNKGFDYYDDREINTVNGRLARGVTDRALQWIESIQDNNFFLFLNYFDPHSPYQPPEGFAMVFLPKGTVLRGRRLTNEEILSLYDGEILYMDYYFGKLLQKLKSDNLYDKTMIIITADHGELFGEHGKYGHGNYLYQEEIHVPLFIKHPGSEGALDQSDVRIQLNDIMAIILERLGLPLPHGVQAGVPSRIGHPILSEVYPLPTLSQDGSWRAIFEEDIKFIWNSNGNHLLFDLKNDPQEVMNLADTYSERKKNMISDIDRYLAQLPGPGPAPALQELDKDTKDALRSLGYVK